MTFERLANEAPPGTLTGHATLASTTRLLRGTIRETSVTVVRHDTL